MLASRSLRRSCRFLIAAVVLGLSACVSNFSPAQRVQDAANDLTTAARFGRMDIAAAHVSSTGRETFNRQQGAWGNRVSVVDSEVTGLRLRDKQHADVNVIVNWQRIDESEMRTTQLIQRWEDHHGTWLLETQERSGGDVGLLGEATTIVPAAAGASQFESITIR